MMIVTAYLRLSGFFGLVTAWTVRLAHTPLGLLAAVVWVAGPSRRCSSTTWCAWCSRRWSSS
jgi:hypothetical protein